MTTLMELADHTRTDKNRLGAHNYFETYEKLFAPLRQTTNTVLEIGIDKGGSIKLWTDFFPLAKIIGVDPIDVNTSHDDLVQLSRVSLFFKNNAYDLDFFESELLHKVTCDVVIDDGPHTLASMMQCIVMYSKLLSPTGVLVIEDVQNIEWVAALRSVVPDHLREFIEVYDLRPIANRYDDILFVINRNKQPPVLENPQICVSGIGGLGNTLYQVACAIDYCERNPNATIVLMHEPNASALTDGTADISDRKQAMRDPKTNQIIPYTASIFRRFAVVQELPTPRLEFQNHYDAKQVAWNSAKLHLEIQGYQQHRDLFQKTMRAWPNYLTLYNKNIVRHLVKTYGNGAQTLENYVCIGIRRCDDFRHMKAITNRALNRVKKEFYPDFHVLIVSDTGNPNAIADGDEPLDFPFTLVNEADIVQLNLAYLCRALICSESTFHAWLGYFMEVANSTTDITCFNNTDLTRRNLTLPNWRHVDV